MSRLDFLLRRLTAQRACLEWAMAEIAALPGPVLEFGLGNGRSYDHLREHLPGRDIYVFDRAADAIPDCVPPADRMLLGDFRDSVPAALGRFAGQVALIHADIGNIDLAASRALAALLLPHWLAMLRPGGLLVSDQPIESPGLAALQLPAGAPAGPYQLSRRIGLT